MLTRFQLSTTPPPGLSPNRPKLSGNLSLVKLWNAVGLVGSIRSSRLKVIRVDANASMSSGGAAVKSAALSQGGTGLEFDHGRIGQ
ncbi:hypothetical protein EVAR_34791_1 [Eumeta japonica]|uniref:Uncharacterized protein n=1 Tax=Eumeta variegata TaxID=151549 RepID=A0A4C1WA82_EUMVA|nr:hypothetical protein EVAR_34791_1 [Eumeta japonica]